MCVKECSQLLIVSVSRQKPCLFIPARRCLAFVFITLLAHMHMLKNHDRHASGHRALFMILHLV